MRAAAFRAAGLGIAVVLSAPTMAAEAPKYGGTLTYMIPADAPPSFDAHHEQTFATIHTAAPFYSVLIRINPENPSSTEDFVCDLCTEMPKPTDDGKTYTFKIRQDVKFHNGDKLTADDVAASWNSIIFPPPGILSPRSSQYMMVKDVEATDPETIVFHLKFATTAFLPALADPYNWIYQKKVLDKDPHWYEHNILGSGPFKFAGYQTGQSISGVRNPDYYRKGLPYLDGFTGIYAPKQATQIDAIRADRASTEFRGYPPAAMDELTAELGDKVKVLESDWNCGSTLIFNHQKKPFDDVRVRRALSLAIEPLGQRRGSVQDRQCPYRRQHCVSRLAAGTYQGGAADDRRLLARYRKVARRGAPLAEGSRSREPQFRGAEPKRGPAVQICRHLGGRSVEQDRRPRDAESGPNRAVVRGPAQRRLQCQHRCQLPQHRQPGYRRAALPAYFSVQGAIRLFRRPEGGRSLRQGAV
jgi:ABC-type transport system substrate-binding protein